MITVFDRGPKNHVELRKREDNPLYNTFRIGLLLIVIFGLFVIIAVCIKNKTINMIVGVLFACAFLLTLWIMHGLIAYPYDGLDFAYDWSAVMYIGFAAFIIYDLLI